MVHSQSGVTPNFMVRFKPNLVVISASLLLVIGGAIMVWRLANEPRLMAAEGDNPNNLPRAFTGAIGVQVFRNQNRLDPLTWYQSQDFRQGSPRSTTVDGFTGLEEGSSVYVSAPNYVHANPTPSAYVNIYLLSYGQGSDADTIEIAKRLRANWQFMANLPENVPYGPAIAREELRRDNERFTSLGTIAQALQQYRQQHSNYPDLAAGTYIPGQTVSTWPSWTDTFSNDIGIATPVDPINNFDRSWPYDGPSECNGNQGFASTTCYAPPHSPDRPDGAYSCPDGSHVFQYTRSTALNYTRLYANFEFKNINWQGSLTRSTAVIDDDNTCQSFLIDLDSRGASWGVPWSQS